MNQEHKPGRQANQLGMCGAIRRREEGRRLRLRGQVPRLVSAAQIHSGHAQSQMLGLQGSISQRSPEKQNQ